MSLTEERCLHQFERKASLYVVQFHATQSKNHLVLLEYLKGCPSGTHIKLGRGWQVFPINDSLLPENSLPGSQLYRKQKGSMVVKGESWYVSMLIKCDTHQVRTNIHLPANGQKSTRLSESHTTQTRPSRPTPRLRHLPALLFGQAVLPL